MSEQDDTTRAWGKCGRTSEEPDVEAHTSTFGRADAPAEPDAQSPEQKAEHKKGSDQPPDVEAHWSKFGG